MKSCAFAMGVLGVFGTAAASEGALEINQDCVAVGCFAGDDPGFPVTITQGGRYRLTSDLDMQVASPAAHGLEIASPEDSSVDLDFGGFSLDGRGRCTGNPVTSCTSFVNGGLTGISASDGIVVRIHDGTVRGMQGPGLGLTGLAGGSSFENVTVTECNTAGFSFAGIILQAELNSAVRLVNVRASRNRVGGLHIVAPAFVTGATVAGNGGYGLQGGLPGITVRESAFSDNAGFGVTAASAFALGTSSFFNNNANAANPQYSLPNLRDMGGNVCGDGACP